MRFAVPLASLAAMIVWSPAAAAPESPLAFQSDLDHVWTMTAATLVFLMQVGFLLLEAGQVRSKNSVNVAQKNLMDFIVSTVVFGAFGYMLMFGTSASGLLGWQPDLLFFGSAGDWSLTFFLFQLMFCGTAATIMSGAVAERMSINGYLLTTVLIAAVIYPVAGHWAWGGLLNGQETPWLAALGFMDFAGSTVVHSVGAWVALAAIIVIGPRIGKFDEAGKPRVLHGHSPILSTAGALILWVGWIGFNGGSMLAGTSSFAGVVVNTIVAGGAGGFLLMFLGRYATGFFRPEAPVNGVLGGLVAITAGADVMTPQASFFIGMLAGLVVFGATWLLETVLKLDDPLGAIPVHGFAGAFGTLAIPFFAPEDTLVAGDRMAQFLVQFQGVGLVFAWSFGLSWVALKGIDMAMRAFPGGGGGLRVSERVEREGLNTHEHNAPMGTGILQGIMAELARDHSGGLRTIDLDHGDDAYETSVLFNRIVANIAAERDEEQARYEMNKTKRMEVEAEIAGVVAACVAGDFSHRLGLEGRSGFLLELCRGINTLCDTTETALNSVRTSLHAIAGGDLGRGIEGRFEGVFGEIQRDLDNTIGKLASIVGGVNSAAAAASRGDFSTAMSTEGRDGIYLDLARSMNAFVDVSERGLSELFETLKRIGAGDLTAGMSAEYDGRFAEIGDAVDRMNHGIGQLIGRVTKTSMNVARTGGELAQTSASMREGAERQASAVTDSMGLLRSLEVAAQETADEARSANELCRSAFDRAEHGHNLVLRFAERMQEIRETSDEITKSLDQIEIIARQTSLLSVNASVEAHRGGGDGGTHEGFKVVAAEVRALARQSAEAAEAIRTRADAVRAAVGSGTALVGESETQLTEIIMAMGECTERVGKLAENGSRQLQTVSDLAGNMSTVSERATATKDQASRTAEMSQMLDDEAAETIELFSNFRLPGESRDLAA